MNIFRILKKNKLLDFLMEEVVSREEYQRRNTELEQEIENLNNKIIKLKSDELYEKQLQEINMRNLIQNIYKMLSEENISKFQRYKRATRTFGDLSKREIKEIMRRNKDAGIDWYHEM